MNEKEKMQPKVRFREFTGENAPDWEQRKLGEIANMHARIGWQNLRTSEFLDSGEYMLITGTDFQDGKIDYSKVHYVEKERYEQDKKIQILNGSILITKDGTIGKVAYVENLPMKATLNAGVFNLTVVDDINTSSLYLYHYLKGPFLLRFVNKESTGGTIKHLNQNVLVKFPIPLPSYREQLKISSFLTNIDKLLTLHQRKLEQLEQLKNTLLSKMFPKSGTNIPEIRFSGFTDAWKQRKLKEMLEERNELILESKDYPLMSFVQGKGVIPKSNRYDRSFLVKNDKKKYKKTELNDFIYSSNNLETGSIGFNKTGNAVISPVYSIFKSKNKLESRFIGIISRRKDFIAKMLKFRQGVVYGQWKIDEDDFLNISVFTPNIETQKYIIDLFIIIDNYIAIHQRKLEQLKNLKQTLLNKMFV